mmetsp:Transcript_5080/g.7732  ORF Transcript_5080/g.7732 Transcript_5080/m.7732 type:complete len:116 (-) Transcript_5080:90-437(-)
MDLNEEVDDHDKKKFYSVENIKHNEKVLNYCRTSLCIFGGISSGILGCTGLWGLLMFVSVHVGVSLAIAVFMMGFDVQKYSRSKNIIFFAIGDASKYGLSFVLFWTLAYTLVYIY